MAMAIAMAMDMAIDTENHYDNGKTVHVLLVFQLVSFYLRSWTIGFLIITTNTITFLRIVDTSVFCVIVP